MMQMHVFGKPLHIGFHMNENPQWCKPPTLDATNRGTRGEMWKKERVDDKNRRCNGRKNFYPFRPSGLGGELGAFFVIIGEHDFCHGCLEVQLSKFRLSIFESCVKSVVEFRKKIPEGGKHSLSLAPTGSIGGVCRNELAI